MEKTPYPPSRRTRKRKGCMTQPFLTKTTFKIPDYQAYAAFA